jgi:hypothetical protein
MTISIKDSEHELKLKILAEESDLDASKLVRKWIRDKWKDALDEKRERLELELAERLREAKLAEGLKLVKNYDA